MDNTTILIKVGRLWAASFSGNRTRVRICAAELGLLIPTSAEPFKSIHHACMMGCPISRETMKAVLAFLLRQNGNR